MSRIAEISQELAVAPFHASTAISKGLISPAMVRGRAWQRLFPDVYVNAAQYDPDNHQMWCTAAALTLPRGACLGGWSAAILHGVTTVPRDQRVWANLPPEGRMRPRNRLLTYRTPMLSTDQSRIGDIPVTTPLRTAYDLARLLPPLDALLAVDAMCHHLVKLPGLEAYSATRWSWPGSRQLRELLPLVEPLAESPMETRVRMVIVDVGLPRPVAQYEIRTAQGVFIGRVDLAYPEWKIAIEYEGDHHRERKQFQHDITRLNALRQAGWLVLRFTADDVLRHPRRLVAQVMAAIEERR
jgi:hypothetical protein